MQHIKSLPCQLKSLDHDRLLPELLIHRKLLDHILTIFTVLGS